ncbi:hypothetical protein N1027_04635 [Herbiconiux sp. CPCC 205763]|uniref:Restriction endonuclease type II DpnII-like domain-containing protein n=1 Tax=Herbiconiux aconitum TaxID=2970913 RepID=A0ABT2GRK5_9MICO|nr:hypothetical protein [Herbiconiux aconitum]MCS5717421.1 hypothetical protein [Herbiconiux aconitum]
MGDIPSFDEYLSTLGRMSRHVDPTLPTAAAQVIHDATESLARLAEGGIEAEDGLLAGLDGDAGGGLHVAGLAAWAHAHPEWVPALGLTVGLSQERLKNSLRHEFDTPSWAALARTRPVALVEYLDRDFGLIRLLETQLGRTYTFSDILVARAGSRVAAISAGASGRRLEDEIEAIASDLGLSYGTRTRFSGRNRRTAPCDLVVPATGEAQIVVAAKGFDSTGSKLTDAVREIEEMADVRLPQQFVIAVIDGIGWKSGQADLRRIHALWESHQIDGMYSLNTLPVFRADLERAARLRDLL